MDFFGKKLPAWLLLTALVIVGAGAATGLVLKDQIDGTTTIAVSQAILIDSAPEAPSSTYSDHDEFLGTANDDGTQWAAHFEANNGDELLMFLPLINEAGSSRDIACLLTMDIPEGLSVNIEEDGTANVAPYASSTSDISNVVQVGLNVWKFMVDGATDDDTDRDGLRISIAIEDAAATGFYELSGIITPVNV